MKSSINVRYNVYAPKAERNCATFEIELRHTDRLSARIIVQTAARHELTRADAFTLSREHQARSAVRSSEKRLNSEKNTNDSVFLLFGFKL